ncbi:hypothetical protein QUA27_18570 [Microcoleus sp. Pol14C6]|uniref:hypothetical protein n=1 Tax=unclassified Microcoleus TaxID=2642155 RepID=UPI002FD0BBDA
MLCGELMLEVDRKLGMMIMCDRTLYNHRSVWYVVRGAIALFYSDIAIRTIIGLFGISCEGRSLFMRDRAIAIRAIIALEW